MSMNESETVFVAVVAVAAVPVPVVVVHGGGLADQVLFHDLMYWNCDKASAPLLPSLFQGLFNIGNLLNSFLDGVVES